MKNPALTPLEQQIQDLKDALRIAINIIEIDNDQASSDLILQTPSSLLELLETYDSILDKHAPVHKPTPWYTPTLLALKSACCHLRNIYSSSLSTSEYKILCTTTNKYHK